MLVLLLLLLLVLVCDARVIVSSRSVCARATGASQLGRRLIDIMLLVFVGRVIVTGRRGVAITATGIGGAGIAT